MARPLLAGAGPRLLDVGTGPGVPGLPLKILDPERHLVLVESNVKKATFLSEAVELLELDRVTVIGERLETALAESMIEAPVHVLTARAWTGWGALLGSCAPLMAPGGRAVLFVGQETFRTLRRVLAAGPSAPRGGEEPAWTAAAAAGWRVRRVERLPHLDTGVMVSLEIPTT